MESNRLGIQPNQLVSHPLWGQGTVRFLEDDIANVRFAEGSKDVALADLTPLSCIQNKIQSGQSDRVLAVICRAQALVIASAQARWGVYSRSKIELLPHQLWVCHRVCRAWPARWLVADDVGLGKTIEAGLILSAFLARGQIKRILILCPAPLVGQWQERMRRMFGIRTAIYHSSLDGPHSTFWEDSDAVIASLDTVKSDHKGRQSRVFEAPPFDLLLVDEAHRLGSGPQNSTQAFRFVRELSEKRRAASMLFFTGTPHRGHDWGFYALLSLLRNDFDPKKPARDQIAKLGEVLIRNNKALVTDMNGQKLFGPLSVSSETYGYSPEEAQFYEKLTNFIASGQLYASGLGEREGRAVMLVLVAMQKLASSSVAAIAGAIRTRLSNLGQIGGEAQRLARDWERALENGDDEAAAALEEQLAGARGALALVEGEETILKSLRDDADQVTRETKIERILELLETRFAGRNVLFFTEYKATQRLLLEALFQKYGDESAGFINGDNALARVELRDGRVADLVSNRAEAARMFNAGEVRFLISTEAGGEGIDLQNSCFTLVHVDLPWNPMRLHQRVGRLHRFGQKHAVEVVSLRNPDTVESLVWEHLNVKLARINGNLNAAMEAPEDLSQLVLGLASGVKWNEIFAQSRTVARENLGTWFDEKTKTLGGEDVLETVKNLVGVAAHFDFRAHSKQIPQTDLPDLQPFLDAALALHDKRLLERSFITPQAWKDNPRWGAFLPDRYDEISFNRREPNLDKENKRLIGAGHNALEAGLEEARDLGASFAVLPTEIGGENLAIFRVFDRLSATPSAASNGLIFGVWGEEFEILEDWQVLQKLNGWSGKRAVRTDEKTETLAVGPTRLQWLSQAENGARLELPKWKSHFQKPEVEVIAFICQAAQQ